MRTRRTIALALPLLLAFGSAAAQLPVDTDGDGVADTEDLCPAVDASFLDADGDGCIDPTANMRHLEFWDPTDLPLVWDLQSDGVPNIADGSDQVAIQAAFDAWTTLPGVALSASFGDTVALASGNGLDGINLVSFVDPDFLSLFGSSVLAVGITTSFTETTLFEGRVVRPGQIVDADMLFNPTRFFSTGTTSSGVDLQSVATHEAGHLFGLNHSAIVSATMFPALPGGQAARSLESDDRLLAFMAYPDPTALANAASLAGTVTDGATGLPIAAAAVFAISASTGDTTAVQFTFEDGSYRFAGLPDDSYRIYVHPIDGSAGINGVVPGFVNDRVDSVAVTLFVPEFYDAAESATDDGSVSTPVTVAAGVSITGIDVITNVDAVAPGLDLVAPGDGDIDVGAEAVILVRFDEAVDFDSVPSRFHLDEVDVSGRTGVGGSLVALSGGDVFVFTPTGRLDFDADYELVLDPGVADLFGNPTTTALVSGFRTESKPPLAVNGVDPTFVQPGMTVVVSGEGFETGVAADNLVDFGGVTVPAQTATFNRLTVLVPTGIPSTDFSLQVRTATEVSGLISMHRSQAVAVARGSVQTGIDLLGETGGLAISPDARWAVAATSHGVEAVVVDGSSGAFGSVVRQALPGGTDDLGFTPDGRRAIAISRTARLLRVIDADDGGDASTPIPGFLNLLFDVSLDAEPLGLTVDPAGRRVYVTTAASRVEVYDIEADSPTFLQRVGEHRIETGGLAGPVAVRRDASEVLVLDDAGGLQFFAEGGVDPIASISVGDGGRDITVDPFGSLAYVPRDDGRIQVVVLDARSVSQTMTAGGSLRGMAVSPSGTLGFVTDRRDDELVVMDLDVGSPLFRTVATSIPVGADPVDVVVSPDGLRAFTLDSGARRLSILGIGFGPIVRSIHPTTVRPGDLLALGGTSFVAFDSTFTAFTSTLWVDFAGTQVSLPNLSSTFDRVWVRVPDGFSGGAITVQQSGAVAVGVPDPLVSNPVFVNVVDDEDLAETLRPLLRSLALAQDVGLDWGTGVTDRVDINPRGDYGLVESLDGFLQLIDLRTDSPTYLLGLGILPVPSGIGPDRVFTPDGRHLYTRVGNAVRSFDAELGSPTLGQVTATVDFSALGSDVGQFGGLGTLGISPDGQVLLIESKLFEGFIYVPITGESQNSAQQARSTNASNIDDMVFHPGGRWVYFVTPQGTLDVFGLDPHRADFLTETATVRSPFQGLIQDAVVSPDGRYLFAVTRESGPAGSHVLELYTLENPAIPRYLFAETLEAASSTRDANIVLHPNGQRALIDIPERRVVAIDLSFAYDYPNLQPDLLLFEEINTFPEGGNLFTRDLEFTPDGSRMLWAEAGDTFPALYDYEIGDLKQATVFSGADQIGVAGQPLVAPIRVLVTSQANGEIAPGALIDVLVDAGGGTIDGQSGARVYAANGSGVVEIHWTLGPDVVPDPLQRLKITPRGTLNSVIVQATATADPSTLPLAVAETLPVDAATDVSVTTTVQVAFNRPIDRASIDPTSVLLREASTGTPVPVQVGFADSDRRVSLLPMTTLPYATDFEFVVTAAVADLAGGALTTPLVASFRTGSPPPPSLDGIQPPSGAVGAEIVISGDGFDPVPANNRIHLGATTIVPGEGGVDFLRFHVPLGATSGLLNVEVAGVSSAGQTFNVLAPSTNPVDEVGASLSVGSTTQALAILPDGSKGYAVSTETDQLLPIDLDTLAELPPVAVGDQPVAVVVSPSGALVYCANAGDGTVSVVDTALDAQTASIFVGGSPSELVVDPSGDVVYVVQPGLQQITLIDTDATSATFHGAVASLNTGASTRGATISPDGSKLYLGTDTGFLVISLEPTDFGAVASLNTGSSTRGATITPDGTLLILVTTDGVVLVVDVSPGGDNAVVASLNTGSSTRGATISPDGSLLYLLQEDTDDILVFAIEISGSVSVVTPQNFGPTRVQLIGVATIDAGDDPGWVAFDPTGRDRTYVGANGDRTINVLGRNIPGICVGGELCVKPRRIWPPQRYRDIAAYYEPPDGFTIEDVHFESMTLNGLEVMLEKGSAESDYDADGVADLFVCFDRCAFQEAMDLGESVEVCIEGTIGPDSLCFSTCDTITTWRPAVAFPDSGTTLTGGETFTIAWTTPFGANADYAEVYWSGNDGKAFYLIDRVDPDTGSLDWVVPDYFADQARLIVVLYRNGQDIGATMSCQPFALRGRPIPVLMQEVAVRPVEGDGKLEWTAARVTGLTGFSVRRAVEDGPFETIGEVRAGSAQKAPGGTVHFAYVDQDVRARTTYLYQLVELREDGSEGFVHGPYELRFTVENRLEQNVPNAFNPRTTIRFSVASRGKVELAVFDLRGRRVKTLVSEELASDVYTVEWDGQDDRGRAVSSGIYLYRLQTPRFQTARKMTLLR